MPARMVWDTPPSVLAARIEEYGLNQLDGVLALAESYAVKGQNEMKAGAPWTDRTGNARAGLLAVAVREGDKIVLYFVHSVAYGLFLELANGGKYQIVWVTMVENANQLMSQLRSSYG